MKQPLRYPSSVSLLHWLLAIMLVGNLAIGWMLDDKEELLDLHKSVGIAILIMVLIRLANRFRVRHRLPPSVNETGTSAHFAEVAAHCLLYVLILATPLFGWLKTNAAGHATSCFGLFSLPTILPRSRELSHWLGQLHSLTAYGLAALVGLHMLGVLAHRLLRRHNILPRILPLLRRPISSTNRVQE